MVGPRRKEGGNTETQGKMMEAEIRMDTNMPRMARLIAGNTQSRRRGRGTDSPQERTWSCLGPTSDSRPRNCENEFLFLKPLQIVAFFITAALRN